ncbi:unnamed protein product, partial [Brassica rapa]
KKKRLFCIRYAFQVAMYTLWRERNKLQHGENIMPIRAVQYVLKRMIDKGVRNKLSLMRSNRVRGMESSLQFWFSTRL